MCKNFLPGPNIWQLATLHGECYYYRMRAAYMHKLSTRAKYLATGHPSWRMFWRGRISGLCELVSIVFMTGLVSAFQEFKSGYPKYSRFCHFITYTWLNSSWVSASWPGLCEYGGFISWRLLSLHLKITNPSVRVVMATHLYKHWCRCGNVFECCIGGQFCWSVF